MHMENVLLAMIDLLNFRLCNKFDFCLISSKSIVLLEISPFLDYDLDYIYRNVRLSIDEWTIIVVEWEGKTISLMNDIKDLLSSNASLSI